jgi:hypothetical protein
MMLSPEDVALPVLKARCGCWGPGSISDRVMRRVYGGPIGGGILFIDACHDEIGDQYELLSDLIPFWLATHPLQSGEVRPYPV